MMGAMLATVLQSVHMPTNYNHNADHEHDLATIVYTLVTLLGQTSQTVVSILSSIPTMTEQTLKVSKKVSIFHNMKELLVQTSTTNADMNQRAIKSFIHDLISVHFVPSLFLTPTVLCQFFQGDNFEHSNTSVHH